MVAVAKVVLHVHEDNSLLINIDNLEELNAIRYDLNGDGTPTTAGQVAYREAFGLTGVDNTCSDPTTSLAAPCQGYELRANLDFDDADGDGGSTKLSRWAESAAAANPTLVEGMAVAGGWTPIGDLFSNYFAATFEGNNYTIKNLYSKTLTARRSFGLFGAINATASVRNLRLENANVTKTGSGFERGSGLLIGYNDGGTISACSSTGSITGPTAGGLVGRNDNGGTISDSYSTATVRASAAGGGLVGSNDTGTITSCRAEGNLEATVGSRIGGLVGFNDRGIIRACSAMGNVSITGSKFYSVGGLVGSNNNGTITSCRAEGNIEATVSASEIGGLVGYNDRGIIRACSAMGNVTVIAKGGTLNIGGLVGLNGRSPISASYATGEVMVTGGGINFNVGGLMGSNDTAPIVACYATGKVTMGATTKIAYVGGLVGFNDKSTIAACYATGEVKALEGAASVLAAGGLVGFNKGSKGKIRACYATGAVTTGNEPLVGGLVGRSEGGSISTCYATGEVTAGNGPTDDHIYSAAGLVGKTTKTVSITNCYSTGDVTGGEHMEVGGLVGIADNRDGSTTITASYFDKDAAVLTKNGTILTGNALRGVSSFGHTDESVKATSSMGKTTDQLKYPRAYDEEDEATGGTAIYSAWNIDVDNELSRGVDDGRSPGDPDVDDPWDFGTRSQYPKLKVDFDESGIHSAYKFGGQERSAPLPSEPTNLAADAVSDTQIDLSWGAPDDDSILNYRIDHSENGVDFTVLHTTPDATTLTYSHTSLSAGTTHYYKIAAINNVGAGSYTSPVEARTYAVPNAPTSFTVDVGGRTELSLSWVAPADVVPAITSYEIQSSSSTDATTFTDLHTISDAATLTYLHSGLTVGETRYYRVAAVNSMGRGAYTSVLFATTSTMAIVPTAPTNLAADAVSDTKISLSWEAPSSDGGEAITKYTIQSSTNGTDFTDLPTTSDATTVTYLHTSLTERTTYYYQVAAINSIGTGGYATAVSATTHAVPELPTNLAATASGTQINLSWEAPSSDGGLAISRYTIQSSTSADAATFTPLHTTSDAATVTYLHTSLPAGTTYYYRVEAVNSLGTGDYATAAATTHDVPEAPTNLRSLSVAPYQVDLSWEAPSSDGGSPITSYTIQYSINRVAFLSPRTIAPTELSYSERQTSHGTWYYRIAATNKVGTGSYTSEVEVIVTPDDRVPAVPKDLRARTESDTQINLSWGEPSSNGGEDLTSYTIQYSTDGSTFTLLHTTSDPTTVTYSHMRLPAGTPYYYQVAATNSIGTGGYATAVSATTHAVPEAPMSFAVNAVAPQQIDLSWEVPSSDGGSALTSYKIQYSTDGRTFTLLHTTSDASTLTYSHTRLTAGTPYHYQVAATNSIGTGAYATAVSASTPPTAVAPSVPKNLMAASPSRTRINLSWNLPSSDGGSAITSYKIQYSTDGGINFSDLHTTSDASTAYSHTGLPAGTTYSYKVAAINSIGTGAETTAVEATTFDPPIFPAVPTSLAASAESGTQINLSWDLPSSDGGSAITSYKIQHSENGTDFSVPQTISDPATQTYSHMGLTVGSTHYYRVAAVNDVGRGSYTLQVEAMTHDVPEAPRKLRATPSSGTQIEISWEAPSSDAAITSYTIQVSTDVGINFSDLHTTSDASTLTYSHTSLTAGNTYHYQVAAVSNVGTGAYAAASTMTSTIDLAPSAPRNLRLTTVASNQVDLSWDEPSSNGGATITGYVIQYFRIRVASTNFVDLAMTDATTLAYPDATVPIRTARTYRVAAVNSVGRGAYSAEKIGGAASFLPAPRNLSATPVSGLQIDLSWEAPLAAGVGIGRYKIQSSEDGTNFNDLYTTSDASTLTYSHTGLTEGNTYYYKVAGVNANIGAYATVSATTLVGVTPPLVPSSLVATAVSPTQINLFWEAPASDGGSPIARYKIQFSTDGGANFTNLHTTPDASTLTYLHTSLTAETTYHYQVVAINAVGIGASATVNASTPATTIVPTAPRNLGATPVSATQIDLSWSAPISDGGSPITSYEIQYSEDGTDFTDLHTTPDNSTRAYSHTSLTAETTYHYQVRAVNNVGTGAYSTATSAMTSYTVLAFVAVTAEADVSFTPASDTIASYTLTKSASDLAIDNDKILTLEAGTDVVYALVGDHTANTEATSSVTDKIAIDDASGIVSTTANAIAVADTTIIFTFYVKATRGPSSVAAKVVLTVSGERLDPSIFGLADEMTSEPFLYPNPATDKVYVSGLAPKYPYIYEIYSLWGQQVLTGQLSEARGLDLEVLSAGTYVLLLRSTSDRKALHHRFLIRISPF